MAAARSGDSRAEILLRPEPAGGLLLPEEEARLVAAARAGDSRAMGRLLRALSGPAYRFGRGFCRDPHDAEDVMQEVLTALARGISGLRGEGSLTSWAYVVARRACMRHRRRRSGEPERVASLDAGSNEARAVADRQPGPSDRLERRQLASLLEEAFTSLPVTQREVILLRDVEGMSAPQVAKILGLGERAVKSRLHRARVALREALGPRLADGTGPVRHPAARAPGCPDTVRLVSRYLEGEMTPARCDELAAHVGGCPDCQSACDGLRAALGACRDWGRRPLPPALTERVRSAIRQATAEMTGGAPAVANATPARVRTRK